MTSNFEVNHVLNNVDYSDILKDINIVTNTVEIADSDFDSQFLSELISVLGSATVEDAMMSGAENRINIPTKSPSHAQSEDRKKEVFHFRHSSMESPRVSKLLKCSFIH